METDRNYRRYLSDNKILFNLTDRVNRVLLKLSEKIVNLDYVPQLDELLAFCQVFSPIQCTIPFIIKVEYRQLHWWNSTLLLVSNRGRTLDPEDYEAIIKGKASLNQLYSKLDEATSHYSNINMLTELCYLFLLLFVSKHPKNTLVAYFAMF